MSPQVGLEQTPVTKMTNPFSAYKEQRIVNENCKNNNNFFGGLIISITYTDHRERRLDERRLPELI
jgi:hypothetical protein